MILVTGSPGFIGKYLIEELMARGYRVRVALRKPEDRMRIPPGLDPVIVGDFAMDVNWRAATTGVEAVVHLAGKAHVIERSRSEPDASYYAVNVAATQSLAEMAAASGVRRLVFMSSSKVLGNRTPPGAAWAEDTVPAPRDSYARSKLAAEQALWRVSKIQGIEAVVVRAPVVYGPEVKGNIFHLFKLVDRGIPLPLGLVRNRRSFVYVRNLVDALVTVLKVPDAAGQTFHVCDGEPISTVSLVQQIAQLLDRSIRLAPIPPLFLRLAGTMGNVLEFLTGMSLPVNTDNFDRLVSSLVLDDRKIRIMLGWKPLATMHEGLATTASWYQNRASLTLLSASLR